jgi:hypothetical protein
MPATLSSSEIPGRRLDAKLAQGTSQNLTSITRPFSKTIVIAG